MGRSRPTTPEGAGAVVDAPNKLSGAKDPSTKRLLTVDVRCEEERELARACHQPGKEVLEDGGEAVRAIAHEDGPPAAVTQGQVHVARVAFTLVVLRHEGKAVPLLGGDLLCPELEQARCRPALSELRR